MTNGIWDSSLVPIANQGDYLQVNLAQDHIGYKGQQWISVAAYPYAVAAAKAFKARIGAALFIREAWRSLETQDYYSVHPPVAGAAVAPPGTSIHGFGLACDFWSGIDYSFTSEEHLAFNEIAEPLGWLNTGTNFKEPWHYEWSASRVKTTTVLTTASTGTTTPIGDEDMPLNDDDKKYIRDTVSNAFQDVNLQTLIANQVVRILGQSGTFSAAQGHFIQDSISNVANDPNVQNAFGKAVVKQLPKS